MQPLMAEPLQKRQLVRTIVVTEVWVIPSILHFLQFKYVRAIAFIQTVNPLFYLSICTVMGKEILHDKFALALLNASERFLHIVQV